MILKVNLGGLTIQQTEVTGAAAILIERYLRRSSLNVPGVDKKNPDAWVITVASLNGSNETVARLVETAVRTGIAEARGAETTRR